MEFKKYNSIENHYRQKYIDKMVHHNPDAVHSLWIAREKLDGANIQLIFTPNQEMQVGKRSALISRDENFFEIWEVLKKYERELSNVQHFVDVTKVPHRIYGEIYGPGINGRVDYGTEKKIAFFDVEDEEGLYSQSNFEFFCSILKLDHMLPRLFAMGKLDLVLQVDVEIGNTEGVVIKPYDKEYNLNGERFIIKKKSKAFLDAERNDGEPARENTSDIAYNVSKIFLGYINENRVIDIFAKHGKMERMNQMGEYINLVIDDARQDFLKDHDLATLIPDMTQKQEKMVYNVGGIVAGYLRKHL